MATQGELLAVAGDLYDCAIEPKLWPQAMERLAGMFGCPAASVSLQDPRKNNVRLLASWGYSPAFEAKMYGSMRINPFVHSGWFMDVDHVYTGVSFMGRDEYYRTQFYREIMEPFGICDAALSVFAKTNNRFGGLTLPHSTAQGEWSAEQLDEVRIIAPHVRRAITIADLLDARALQQDMLSATLDLLAVGIVLVDAQGRIVHANHAGLATLDQRAALRRNGDVLSARDPKAARDLLDAITAATANATMPAGGIAVPLAGGDRRDLAAWVLPLDRGLRSELAAPFAATAAVFVRELGDTSAFPGELFVKQYGITPAECRVLMMLVNGLSVAETCEALGVSEPTVKTHLSRLFAKTGTSGQADLMRLAVTALAPAQAP